MTKDTTITTKSGKTAIKRKGMSLPLRLVLAVSGEGYIEPNIGSVFDLGHGRGDDMVELDGCGFDVSGWDPNHYIKDYSVIDPVKEIGKNFDLVYCGYVLNVIDNPAERVEVALLARELAGRNGSVAFAVRTASDIAVSRTDKWERYGDGMVTSTGTFQKGFTPAELVDVLDTAGFGSINIIRKSPLVVIASREAEPTAKESAEKALLEEIRDWADNASASIHDPYGDPDEIYISRLEYGGRDGEYIRNLIGKRLDYIYATAARLRTGNPYAVLDQPGPLGDGNIIVDKVIQDLDLRAKLGEKSYGTLLRAHNGRDALLDAYQEALDLSMYLRQALEERDEEKHQ